MRVNVKKVLQAWEMGKPLRAYASIWTDGVTIFSYHTAIITRTGNVLAFNSTQYSRTTTTQQNSIRKEMATSPDARMMLRATYMHYGCSASDLLKAVGAE